MTVKKTRGRRAAKEDPEKEVLYVRAEPELIVALDKEAALISQRAGGLYVSRSAAARVVLKNALAHHMGESVSVVADTDKGKA